jgi:hypothetical protein
MDQCLIKRPSDMVMLKMAGQEDYNHCLHSILIENYVHCTLSKSLKWINGQMWGSL